MGAYLVITCIMMIASAINALTTKEKFYPARRLIFAPMAVWSIILVLKHFGAI